MGGLNGASQRHIGYKIKRAWKLIAISILLLVLVIGGINCYILHFAKNCIFDHISDVPKREMALVMGTDLMRFNGSTNLHFLNRTEGAAILYFSGKAGRLLISGNRNNKGFNEVIGMENEILTKKVPKDFLDLDFEGNSTWESLRRAKEVYHFKKIIIVTDDFHAPRALYLSHHFGIDAVAFCYGKEPFGFWMVRYHAREWFARVKAFCQVLLDTRRHNE